MLVLSLLRKWYRRRQERRAAAQSASPWLGGAARPRLESLEDRLPPNSLVNTTSFIPTAKITPITQPTPPATPSVGAIQSGTGADIIMAIGN